MREKKFTEWISFGENVGREINGKSRLFTRPAIILKKLVHGFYFVIPTSTQIQTGSWYVNFKQNNVEMVACLHQARSIDHRRFFSRLGELDEKDFLRVKEGIRKLYL
ncbi:MAG: type II toxin-antitoxin system PemK/MazF family toxin [Candidatus Gracilibacteria bacterium]|jgi:mRNA-degrading endonuclease toxin of MazEF toxin-antitoxin module